MFPYTSWPWYLFTKIAVKCYTGKRKMCLSQLNISLVCPVSFQWNSLDHCRKTGIFGKHMTHVFQTVHLRKQQIFLFHSSTRSHFRYLISFIFFLAPVFWGRASLAWRHGDSNNTTCTKHKTQRCKSYFDRCPHNRA